MCLAVPSAAAGTLAALPAAMSAWIPAAVPGTVAAALIAAGPACLHGDLHACDHWYRLDVALPGGAWIEFGGLATLAEIWIDGCLAATSNSMFQPLNVPVPAQGGHRLELCFRALRSVLRGRAPGRRARWRGRLAEHENLRCHRTTLLGHMPGWSGDVAVIGPFRPVMLHIPVPDAPVISRADLRAGLDANGAGVVEVRLAGSGLGGRTGSIRAAGHTAPLLPDGEELCGRLVVPQPLLWWPHTHGDPATTAVTAEIDGYSVDLGCVGFRTVERRDVVDGFGLIVNGLPVFCRGAVWAGLDATGQPTAAAALEAALRRARDAGFNMLRVTGMTLYETPAFFALCDALGILVWHEFMFARFDYPDDASFVAAARAEARAFLDLVQAHPCLAVLCGGTEVAQAAAMAGCPPGTWHMPLFEEELAQEAEALRPDVPYVPHSPLAGPAEGPGGGLPFAAASSVAHYFGVGAYLRPLEDLASAGVRFAAECLAFANPPDPGCFGARASTVALREGVPRDVTASWDFEDVRDHYVESLFGVSAMSVRRQDPLAWLALGRAAVALLMQQTISIWRTDGQCGGALVLMLQDVVPGAGWGVVAHDGRPKSAWHALRGVCQPIQVLLRDLGQNGVVLHAINETSVPRQVRLGLRGLTLDGAAEVLGSAVLELAPRESRAVAATALMGRWRDLAHAWQFGPAAFTVLGATLDDAESGARLSDATHFPIGPALPRSRPGLAATLRDDGGSWTVDVSAQGFAQFVAFDDDEFVVADNHFHLWPGESRVVPLRRGGSRSSSPAGSIRALNGDADAYYGLAA